MESAGEGVSKASKNKVAWCSNGYQPLYYGFCPSKKAWDREMKRLGIKDEYPHPDGAGGRMHDFEHSDGAHAVLITICEKQAKEADLVTLIGIMTHEATHVWQTMLDYMGEKDPSPEFEAYSMQFIIMELLTAYDETRGLPRK